MIRTCLSLSLLISGSLCLGCNSSNTVSGCPEDVPLPEEIKIVGSSFDRDLIVLRMESQHESLQELVTFFREALTENGWTEDSDSTTETGGELVFSKDQRDCTILLMTRDDSKRVKVNLKCHRLN